MDRDPLAELLKTTHRGDFAKLARGNSNHQSILFVLKHASFISRGADLYAFGVARAAPTS